MEVVKLKPATKANIWGGNKLRDWGKEPSGDNISEAWELSLHKDGPCLVDSGNDKGKLLSDVATKFDFGKNCERFPFFPVLIKLIDAKDKLSVQVHPSDEYALKNEGQFGKTEMWYVLEAEKGSGLYVGLKNSLTPEEFASKIKDNTITDELNFFEVKPGDTFFIESGLIHAIGGGVTLLEIQQNSSLTYRIYDYDRRDKFGNPRELHVEKAAKVSNLNKYVKTENKSDVLADCKYFTVIKKELKGVIELSADMGSFISVTFTKGSGKIENMEFKKGETFFIPSGKKAKIDGTGEFVYTYIRKE